MSLSLLASNNAQTVLSSSISSTATTLTVNTGTGSLFPSPVSGTSFFKLTLIDSATGTLTEIVHVTQRVGDSMTIERGQEGTSPRIWSANDIAANMMTAGTLTYMLDSFQPKNEKLTSLSALSGGNDTLPYFTGTNSMDQTILRQVGRDILSASTVSAVRGYLELGDSATRSVGITTGTVAAGDDTRIVNAVQKSDPSICTAWVNFGGAGSATIRSSYNVSSVTYVSAGYYRVNFTTPMTSTNYAPSISGVQQDFGSQNVAIGLYANVSGALGKFLSSVEILNQNSVGGNVDSAEVSVIIFGGR